jgi:hypothetical protein
MTRIFALLAPSQADFIANIIFGATSVAGNFVFIKCVVVGSDAGLSTADG